MKLNSDSPEVVEWLAGVQKVIDAAYLKGVPIVPPLMTIEEGSRFLKVVRTNDGGKGQVSVYCFVCREDFGTKTLGVMQCGDVLLPASWRAPARHARGNLFDKFKGLSQIGPYGVAYLK